MTDNTRTVTITPQEQAAFESGWNRAIEAAAKVCRDPGVGWVKAEAIRALSMPAPAQAWRVKPLEWEDYTCESQANSVGLGWNVYETSEGKWNCIRSKPDAERLATKVSLEDAKAAAQADYAARILAALIPDMEGSA